MKKMASLSWSPLSLSSSSWFIVLWVIIPYIIGCFISRIVVPEEWARRQLEPTIITLTQQQSRSLFGNGNGNGNGNGIINESNTKVMMANVKCDQHLRKIFGISRKSTSTYVFGDSNENWVDPFDDVSIVLHRNGEATPCGRTTLSLYQAIRQVYYEEYFYVDSQHETTTTRLQCPQSLNKYQIESMLSKALHRMLLQTDQGINGSVSATTTGNNCVSMEKDGRKSDGFLGFCDMGEERTPILLDHDELVPVQLTEAQKTNKKSKFLPCRFHTREGLRIVQFDQLREMIESIRTSDNNNKDKPTLDNTTSSSTETAKSTELHLYAVPAGRVFMFAPSYIGEIFHLPHVDGANDSKIYLQVLSLNPRIFDVYNFFSKQESEELVQRAQAETSESHRIKRSSTGASGYNLNSRRTSESGFDTHGKTAVKIKKRCFKLLGLDYWESHGDGLQILRYNTTTAYTQHLDWIEDKSKKLEHDFDSAGRGGNRYATILLYMTDMGPNDGGETVFPKAWPPDVREEDRLDPKNALEQFRASEYGDVLERGSWEESMTVQCKTKMVIRPHSSRAVLFYSQKPNGELDPMSTHGACPILSGSKFAANLWVWNTPRQGYPGAPVNERLVGKKKEKSALSSPSTNFKQLVAYFTNTGQDPRMRNAELYFQNKFWGKIGFGDEPLGANTYSGHEWNIKVEGEIVKTWTISDEDGETQRFTI